jgi:hypothetical protein
VALSVDSKVRNAAMARRWKLPFPLLSDPGGTEILQPLELWDPQERGGLALPALLLVSATGEALFRQPSRDFADRVHDDDVLEKLEALGLNRIAVPEPWAPEVSLPEDGDEALQGAFSAAAYVPLMNGNYFGALALAQRIEHTPSRHEVKRHAAMAKSFLEAWKERRQA